jgi:putative drug exporter of the RND superfamily
MATYLYRLARFSFRHRRSVIVAWLLLLAALGVGAASLQTPVTDQLTIPGVQAQQAGDLLTEKFPHLSADGAQGLIVFEAPAGDKVTSVAGQAAVRSSLDALEQLPGVTSVTDPYQSGQVSPNESLALATVNYRAEPDEITAAQRDALMEAPAAARDAGMTVVVGGTAVAASSSIEATEIIGVLVAAVVLAITFGSLVAAGLPLLTALIGVGLGLTGLFTVSQWVQLSSTAPVLALMLGLAVGIDYALFIISRYRRELMRGVEPEQAAGVAGGTAGSAVVFAGLTVVIALAGLAVVGIPFITVMGLAAAGTVAAAVLIALTLLPAMFGFAGGRVIATRIPGVRRPDFDDSVPDARVSFGERWARMVTSRAAPILIIGVSLLGAMTLPALDMRTGLPDNGSAAAGSGPRVAYDLIAENFGAGYNGPLTIVVSGDAAHTKSGAAAVTDRLRTMPDVASVSPPVINDDQDAAVISAVPRSAPSASDTATLVKSIRSLAPRLKRSDNIEIYVTGPTALNIDVSSKLASALPPYLIIVIGLALVLLLLVFRSILVPVKAALGFLLTIGATFGALVAVFQWGWLSDLIGVSETGPIGSYLPIIMIALLFGLSMDYEVFLVSGIRESYAHGAEPTDAVIGGFRRGARVVTAAAIIMTAVFSGFMLGDNAAIKSVGFSLAFGVLIDAFVVRMTLVPAVMSLLGGSAWWLPRQLSRVLPNVDIEGQSLLGRRSQGVDVDDATRTPKAPETRPV